MNYVIIGNSAAAIGCVEGIRLKDKNGMITIISNENYHTYSRPLISYLLYGKTDLDKMKYRGEDFYLKNNCQVILGESVNKIKKDTKEVILSNNQKIPYDKLLVATGSSAFIPKIEGLDQVKKKHTFMSLEDALLLEKDLSQNKQVLIMGAGLIGLKCAEGIVNKVKKITVVDLADRILPSVLDIDGSELVKAHIEKKNISFVLNESVKQFKGNSAILSNGEEISFDILVIAVGVRPNVALVSEIGGKVNRGIVVDRNCKTDLPDIYAAGDCAEGYDSSIEENRILALLPNAYMQGETAGINMAGGNTTFEKAIPMNAIGFFGLHVITAGNYEGEEYKVCENGSYKKLITKDNILKGMILVGNVERAGIYTSLIREKTPLSSIDFDLIKEKPQLMAFSKVERLRKLGGSKE